MPFRILKYLVSIWDLYLKTNKKKSQLPLIYPMIFYTGFNRYNYSTCLFDLFSDNKLAKDIFSNPYQLIDLSVRHESATLLAAVSAAEKVLTQHIL